MRKIHTFHWLCLNDAGEPNMPERIIMALKLSSTVYGKSTSDRGRREVPAAAQDSDSSPAHEIYRKSSHFCGHQKVCEEYTPEFRYTPSGKLYVVSVIHTEGMYNVCVYYYTRKAKSVYCT